MMISKRKKAKLIVKQEGCSDVTIVACSDCPFYKKECRDSRISEGIAMAMEWLETHPKKEKEPWVPKIGDIVIYFWANNFKHGKISYIEHIDNDREYPYHLACDYDANHIGLVKKLKEVKEPKQYFIDKGRYI